MDSNNNGGHVDSNGDGAAREASLGYGNGNLTHASSHAECSGFSYHPIINSSPNQGLENAFSRLGLHGGINGSGVNVAGINGARVNGNSVSDAEYHRSTIMQQRSAINQTAPYYGSSSSFYSAFSNSGPQNSSIWDYLRDLRSVQSLNHHQNSTAQFQSRVSDFRNPNLDFLEPGRSNQTGDRIERQSNWTVPDYGFQHHQPETRNLSIGDVRGKVVSYAMDQNGCRMLQMMLPTIGRQEFDMIFNEAIQNISQLMTDQYGNFIFQKLVQDCTVDQITRIIAAVTRNPFHLTNICLNSYGTRAVQKLLTYLTTMEQKAMMVASLKTGVFQLSKDVNGHHVIVHCVKNFPYELKQMFLDKMTEYCLQLSTDQSGCCVVQSCVDHSRGEARDRLVREILSVTQLLSEDRFGNYVVQCLLRQMDQMINIRVWEELKGNFISLACNKFGSNVVEACLEQSDRRHVELIILEMLENPHVSAIFSDQFGNYVIQAALNVSKGAVHEALVAEIWKHAPSLESNQYGKMTLSWFDPKKRRKSMRNRNKFGGIQP